MLSCSHALDAHTGEPSVTSCSCASVYSTGTHRERASNVRYSWRQDAKWLAAILFVLCATMASFTYILYPITLHQPATGVSAAVIEGMTGGALNDDLFAKLQAAARSNPEDRKSTRLNSSHDYNSY